ncbi:MAG: LamG domain-containing protein, partial [Planctomycetota bacterium]
MSLRKARACPLAFVFAAFLACGASAAGTGLLTPARRFKDAALEKLKAWPASPDESDVTKVLNLLNVARKLLLKHEKPLPREVFAELAEVNALLYWAPSKLPEDAAAVEVPPLLNPNSKPREELALEYFLRARAYASKHPDDHFMIAVRYREVAERFEGTVVHSQARGSAEKHERLAARDAPKAVEKQPVGPHPGGQETAEAPRPDPARPSEATPAARAGGREALARLIAEIDSLIGKGDHAAALSRVERAVADPAFEDFTDDVIAVHGACDSLDARRKAVRAAVEKHVDKEIELRTTKGKLLGTVRRVTDEGVDLLVKKKVPGMGTIETRVRLKWSDLVPKQEDDLARRGGWKAEGAGGAVVLAYVALAREDPKAAGRALADAGEHPLVAHVRRRIDSPRSEAAERAAKAAWEQIEKAARAAGASPGGVRKLVARIEAFEKSHGGTGFASSVRGKATAMKRHARRSLLPRRGLVAHWPLDERDGTKARDVSGNGHHGTLHGAPAWQPDGGRVDGALRFGGGDQYVDCGKAPGSAAALTVAFWMKPASRHTGAPVDKLALGAGGAGWTLKVRAGGALCFVVGSLAKKRSLAIPSGYSVGMWAHVACTYQNGEAKLYLNGTEKGSRSGIKETVKDAVTGLYMGRPSVTWRGERFTGLLDDVRVYDRALSAAEVAALYRAGASASGAAAPSAKTPDKEQPVAPRPSGRPAADAPRRDPARGREALRPLLAEIDSLIGKGDHAAA